MDPGCVHHIAFSVSNATFRQAVERLDEARGQALRASRTAASWTRSTSPSPLGLLIELASYRFEPPTGKTHADVLLAAHRLRVERGDYNIDPVHLADAIEQLTLASTGSLSR